MSKMFFQNSQLESPDNIQKTLKLTTVQTVGGIKCDVCKITFSTKRPYDLHYINHCKDKASIKYTCVVCDKTFPVYHTFRNHCYDQHIIKDKFKCSECGKCFPKILFLNEHISSMHTFRCLLSRRCKQKQEQFKTKAELLRHQMVHKNYKNIPPYNCTSCQKQINNTDDCETHIDAHFAVTYICPICDQRITTEDAKSHLKIHFSDEHQVGKRPHHDEDANLNTLDIPSDSALNTIGGVRCCHCNQLFKDKTEIDLHFMECHKDEEITYTCNVCKKQFTKYIHFGDHCYFHYAKTRFECEKCSKNFDRLVYLVSHQDSCMSDGRATFSCVVCNTSFNSEYKLQRHVRRRGHNTGGGLKCSHRGCGQPFESQTELVLHRKRHHEGNKNFCQTCGVDFQSLESCYKHLEVHKKQQFNCPVCDHLSQDKYKMMLHIPKHFSTMFHACKICGNMYQDKRRFLQHTKTHDNEKNFKCNYCGKSFTKSNHLLQHIHMHTGMKPYKCVACPKAFASYPNWNKHLRKIHNIDAKTVKRPDDNIHQVNLPKVPVATVTNTLTPVKKMNSINSVTKVIEPTTPVTKVTELTTSAVTKVKESTAPLTKVTKITNSVTNVTELNAPVTKVTNSSDFDEFEDDSMDSDSDVGDEINAIEKYLADSFDNVENATTNTQIKNTSVDVHGDMINNNTAVTNKTGELINDTSTAFVFDENYKNATANNDINTYFVNGEKTARTMTTFDFGDKNNKKKAANVIVGMELQEHLNGDAMHETESEMLEELMDIGVLPEPPNQLVSVDMPQREYGPDFINVDSTLPSTAPGELINLDDHVLPHIDPLLTIKCQAGPEYSNLTALTNLDQYFYETGQYNDMNYQNNAGFPNSLYFYDHNDLSDKTEEPQPNLVWGPTTIFKSAV